MSDYKLTEVDETDVEYMLVRADEAMMDIDEGLNEVEDSLIEMGEPILAEITAQALQDTQNLKQQLDHATGIIDALQKGMLALKEQRDDFVQRFQSLKDALDNGNTQHPKILQAMQGAFESGCEAASLSFLGDLEWVLQSQLNLQAGDARLLAMALYCYPHEEVLEDDEEEPQMPEAGKELMLQLLDVLKREGWGR